MLEVLRVQSGATRALRARHGRGVRRAHRAQGQLRELITNSNRVWEAIASRDQRAGGHLPGLPDVPARGPRDDHARLTRVRRGHQPADHQLRPAARQLSPTLIDLDALAPDLQACSSDLGPLVRVVAQGPAGAPSRCSTTRGRSCARLDPFLRNLTPIVDYLGLYKRELAAFFANDSAATQAADVGCSARVQQIHYLRTTNPTNPEMMAACPNAPGHEPLEPVHRAGRLRQARSRGPPRGVRQLPLHRRTRRPPPRRRSTRTARPSSRR